jgi:hypothetical protein
MTPEEDKEYKRRIEALELTGRAIKLQYSFGKIKTFRDLLKRFGYTEEFMERYTFNELSTKLNNVLINEFLSDRHIELTTEYWLKKNPPIITPDENILPQTAIQSVCEICPTEHILPTKTVGDEKNYNFEHEFERSPNEPPTTFFFWFQKKAIQELLDGILGR